MKLNYNTALKVETEIEIEFDLSMKDVLFGKAMVGEQINLNHPLLDVPSVATVLDIWHGGQGLVLSFPCGHVAHLTNNEIFNLTNEVNNNE